LLSNAIDELKALGEQWYWNDASLTKETDFTMNKLYNIMIEFESISLRCSSSKILSVNSANSNELLQKVASTAEILVYKQQNININAQWKDWALETLRCSSSKILSVNSANSKGLQWMSSPANIKRFSVSYPSSIYSRDIGL